MLDDAGFGGALSVGLIGMCGGGASLRDRLSNDASNRVSVVRRRPPASRSTALTIPSEDDRALRCRIRYFRLPAVFLTLPDRVSSPRRFGRRHLRHQFVGNPVRAWPAPSPCWIKPYRSYTVGLVAAARTSHLPPVGASDARARQKLERAPVPAGEWGRCGRRSGLAGCASETRKSLALIPGTERYRFACPPASSFSSPMHAWRESHEEIVQ